MDTRRIPLTKGQWAIVDKADYLPLSRMGSWYYQIGPRNASGYAAMKGSDGRLVLMHRVILGLARGQFSDHINGDTIDNRRANLRAATPSQNMFNRKLNKNNTTGYKGVIHGPTTQRPFLAVIQKGGKATRLGAFSTPTEAATAYNAAAVRLFGPYARLNALP